MPKSLRKWLDCDQAESKYDWSKKHSPQVSHNDDQFLPNLFAPMNSHFDTISIVLLTLDLFFSSENGRQLQIIHNYGHGGSGVTLSYGCAIEVCDIVNEMMVKRKAPKSKL